MSAELEARAARAEAMVADLRRSLEILASHEPSWDDDFCRARATLAATMPEPVRLPDGSGFFIDSFPLPKDHWIYSTEPNDPPPPLPIELEGRPAAESYVRAAARYAIRASTMNGREQNFDPDAMVQNMIVGILGPRTVTGR